MAPEIAGGEGPLYTRTLALDQEEGLAVANMRETHTSPLSGAVNSGPC